MELLKALIVRSLVFILLICLPNDNRRLTIVILFTIYITIMMLYRIAITTIIVCLNNISLDLMNYLKEIMYIHKKYVDSYMVELFITIFCSMNNITPLCYILPIHCMLIVINQITISYVINRLVE
jgi:hypothetical protein